MIDPEARLPASFFDDLQQRIALRLKDHDVVIGIPKGESMTVEIREGAGAVQIVEVVLLGIVAVAEVSSEIRAWIRRKEKLNQPVPKIRVSEEVDTEAGVSRRTIEVLGG